jgi:hypothetical protein
MRGEVGLLSRNILFDSEDADGSTTYGGNLKVCTMFIHSYSHCILYHGILNPLLIVFVTPYPLYIKPHPMVFVTPYPWYIKPHPMVF